MVARMAAFWGGWPHEIWALPTHTYFAMRREYIEIINPRPDKRGVKKGPGGIEITTYETPG